MAASQNEQVITSSAKTASRERKGVYAAPGMLHVANLVIAARIMRSGADSQRDLINLTRGAISGEGAKFASLRGTVSGYVALDESGHWSRQAVRAYDT